MRIRAALVSHRRAIAFWAVAALTLLATHDLVFLIQLGPGEELARLLRSAGHGYWGLASTIIGLAGIGVGLAAALRLRALRRRAAGLPATPIGSQGVRDILPIWGRLLAVVAIGFVVQENVEHFIAHGHVMGLAALAGPEYPLATPVIGLISLAAAIVVGLFVHHERALLASIEAALHVSLGPVRALVRAPGQLRVHPATGLAQPGAGRAPPLVPLRIG